MEYEIGTVAGYKIFYDTRPRLFYLKDSAGELVGQGTTQGELEIEAKRLAKKVFKQLPAFWFDQGFRVYSGRVTSLNSGEQTVRFCPDKGSIRKVNLRYDHGLYEQTERNSSIKQELDRLLSEYEEIEGRIRELRKAFGNPIDLDYFGLRR